MLIHLFKYNQLKNDIPTSIYKMGGPSVKISLISQLFVIPFNFGYVYIISSSLKNFIRIKNSSDNYTKSFMIHEMYGCHGMILMGINIILASVIICSIVENLIITSNLRKRNNYYSELMQKLFCEKKLPYIENLRIKSLRCFKH